MQSEDFLSGNGSRPLTRHGWLVPWRRRNNQHMRRYTVIYIYIYWLMCRGWLELHIKEQQKHNQPLPSNFSSAPENRSICKNTQLSWSSTIHIIRKSWFFFALGHKYWSGHKTTLFGRRSTFLWNPIVHCLLGPRPGFVQFWKPRVKTGSLVGLPFLFYVCMGFLCFSYIRLNSINHKSRDFDNL